jgi:hypothetical protein
VIEKRRKRRPKPDLCCRGIDWMGGLCSTHGVGRKREKEKKKCKSLIRKLAATNRINDLGKENI